MKDTITPKNFILCTRGIHARVESVACYDRIGGATMLIRTERKKKKIR